MTQRSQPDYFEPIRQAAHNRWEQLEADEDLAGPWHMLFSQVQSPRHVLSELLQNADDARATWAKARITENVFWFEHNGEDFDEGSLRSICRFGFSNKRHLHTIGFRGIGFKSTFSLGDRVELFTPTLAIWFDKGRFTEPVWIENAPPCDFTTIRVAIDQPEKISELEDSLASWLSSAVPLLFFQHIELLEIQNQVLRKEPIGVGPVPNSEWISLESARKQKVLRIVSEEEDFPPECVAEIRKERREPDFELARYSVEIIYGLNDEQKLYVVLPTDLRPQLPFSFNAPFIQDPNRVRINSPSLSPTNRWLLKRVGELASQAMCAWLGNTLLTPEDRAHAYDLLPPATVDGHSLDADCARVVLDAFRTWAEGKSILLCDDDGLSSSEKCLGAPAALLDAWTRDELLELFGKDKDRVIARQVSPASRSRLSGWGWFDPLLNETIGQRLRQSPYPPRPAQDDKLVTLWAFLNDLVSETYSWLRQELAIIPVNGRPHLFPSKSVVINHGERDLTDSDWALLGELVPLVDPNWVKLMTSPPQAVDVDERRRQDPRLQATMNVFKLLDPGKHTTISQIMERASETLFGQEPGWKGIALAQIAARADISVPQSFKYLCCDSQWHQVTEGILSTNAGGVEPLLPSDWERAHLLHPQYLDNLPETEKRKWERWVLSSKSNLHRFPIPVRNKISLWRRPVFEAIMGNRGATYSGYYWQYHYKQEHFYINDFDFDPVLWSYWEQESKSESNLWVRVIRGILLDFGPEWEHRSAASADDVSQKQNTQSISFERPPIAGWVYALRSKECLLDNSSKPALPSELMIQNADTAPLSRIERFVHWEIDRPENLKLLNLLGVRTKPDSADTLLERIKAWAGLERPPIDELVSLYEALDQVMVRLDHMAVSSLRAQFSTRELIYSSNETWQKLGDVFRKNDEGIPGILTVHPRLVHLPLWERLNMGKEPTLDLAVDWLTKIPSGARLTLADHKRVQDIIKRAARSVWDRCRHWLNLYGEWVPKDSLRWMIDKKNGLQVFPSIQVQTADFTMLVPDDLLGTPFNGIPSLESRLEYRIESSVTRTADRPEWLSTLARCLMRVDLYPEREDESSRVRAIYLRQTAEQLGNVEWRVVDSLRVVPYVEGEPAGDDRVSHALWQDGVFYATGEGGKHFREMIQALASRFSDQEIKQAIEHCYARDPAFILDYFESNFSLNTNEPAIGGGEINVTGNGPGSGEGDEEEPEIDDGDRGNPPKTSEELGGNDTITVKRRKWLSNQLPRVSEFLKDFGFHWDPEREEFFDMDGNSVRREEGLFPWVRYDSTGNVIGRYWFGDRSLEDGLILNAEIWNMLKQPPHNNWLVLPINGKRKQYSWLELGPLIVRHELEIHTAKYRICIVNGHGVEHTPLHS